MKVRKHFVIAIFAALAAFVAGIGCAFNSPLQRHCELEWHLRHRMPNWSPADWNAWEAELAAAMNEPIPDPPMFPDADAPVNADGIAEEQPDAN